MARLAGWDLGSRAKLAPGSYLWWYPAEVNVTILANGAWFWAPRKHPRSLSELVDIYYRSIGRNGNLILNLSPDKRGLIPDDQLEALSKMAQVVKDTFATDLAAGGKLTADNSNDAHESVIGAGRKPRHLVGSRAGPHQRHIDLDAAGRRHLRRRLVAGSGGSSRATN